MSVLEEKYQLLVQDVTAVETTPWPPWSPLSHQESLIVLAKLPHEVQAGACPHGQ